MDFRSNHFWLSIPEGTPHCACAAPSSKAISLGGRSTATYHTANDPPDHHAFLLQHEICRICIRSVRNLTSQEESQTHPNTDRDSHVAVPSGEFHPYTTSNPSAESPRLEEEASVEEFTRGSAVRIIPISRMLRHAPFPEQSSGQAYLMFSGLSAGRAVVGGGAYSRFSCMP